MRLRELLRRGDPAIWFTGAGLGVSLLMIGGMIALILVNGLGVFWPKRIARLTLTDGAIVLGEIAAREAIPRPGAPPGEREHRVQVKVGNRDLFGADFRWIDESVITSRTYPPDAVYVERREYGPFIGTLLRESGAGLVLRAADGQEKEIAGDEIVRAYRANTLSLAGRVRVYASRVWEFLAGEPRESNTEGGIFPAIFGTVMMVIIMSLLAVPFGVLAALYLREYAHQGPVVRLVRIAVNNLAGVPSIVFGLFGLGFFVYFVGGAIDRSFFPERLPTPTFGTGGILWASLTLALLTVPVVIVAAEEALGAVPRSMREASLATGATKFQTIVHVVLPAAAPGILTGLILAMARGAGEVAPLMITGVVKLAPDLPIDGVWPFLHLDRKFMHLGFHIYDVGFQSPNVEAAKPMVYATAILLLAVVVALNLTAIVVRNHLRKRYQTSAF